MNEFIPETQRIYECDLGTCKTCRDGKRKCTKYRKIRLDITIDQLGAIRRQVKKAYRGNGWYKQVNTMDEIELYALWKSLIAQKRIKNPVDIPKRGENPETKI